MSYQLIDIVQRLGCPRILVLGDLILDRYIWGDAERVSQEAPVILLREERQEIRPGGAANVANLLRGLEANVVLAGVVGADDDGRQLRETMESADVDCSFLIADPSRPTTVKQRYMGLVQHRHPHQILRVDRETRTPVSNEIVDQMVAGIAGEIDNIDAVLISDYAKGVCTPELLSQVIRIARDQGLPVIVDPAAGSDYRRYENATAVTPNRLETQRATGRPIETAEDAFTAGRRLCAELSLDCCFVTLDSDGIALTTRDGLSELLPTRKREVYDITGAGDMVLAMIGVGAAAGVPPADLARLANVAGGLEVEQVGVVRVTRQQILADLFAAGRNPRDKVGTLDEVARHVEACKQLGQRIVFTNGCFDLLHPGHVQFLSEASSHGDCLIVAINSDDGVRKHKGPNRPVIRENDRASMLAALQCVDRVIIFQEETPHSILHRLRPHVLVKGGTTPQVVAREVIEAYGGQVMTLETHGNFSTTAIIKTLQEDLNAA
ncbi:MAG: bifunctional heptose 7-phosphate kinase/heptose 1-phosphate adenyltransferase [Planctomycetes bacterium]|nr:bifunctional heptose 7-phosphate kinase/heptose 1-phosphate adenyltransferase [Planctomycetota bacterium]